MNILPFINELIYDSNKKNIDFLSNVSQLSPASISNYIKVRDELVFLYQKKCIKDYYSNYKECELIRRLLGIPP